MEPVTYTIGDLSQWSNVIAIMLGVSAILGFFGRKNKNEIILEVSKMFEEMKDRQEAGCIRKQSECRGDLKEDMKRVEDRVKEDLGNLKTQITEMRSRPVMNGDFDRLCEIIKKLEHTNHDSPK
jgi:hypothetical protein